MRKHADWKQAAVATVVGRGRVRRNCYGNEYVDYFIEFDHPQADYTDEMHGDVHRTYSGTTCAEEFLEPLHGTEDENGCGQSLNSK